MPIGNFVGNQASGWQNVSNTSALASSRSGKDFVVYRGKKHYLAEALFYVKYENTTYAVLPVDEIALTPEEQPEDLMLTGYVYKARPEENDLTDMPGTETAPKYGVYKLKKAFYVQVPKRESVCLPMVKVS